MYVIFDYTSNNKSSVLIVRYKFEIEMKSIKKQVFKYNTESIIGYTYYSI